MAKRLLSESAALRKIELSLKLQGKTFKPERLKCCECKFDWSNTDAGRPRWNRGRWNFATHTYENSLEPKPEKFNWYCFKYKNSPTHAFLKFNVVRLDAQGQKVGKLYHTTSDGSWSCDPLEGEKDTLVRATGRRYKYKVCRRFESAPKK